ncbi:MULTISPECIES: condensation domain-containing protein, partial [unclassified Bradyrhizobium]
QCFDAPPCTNLELIDVSHLTSSEAEELIAQFRRTELKDNFDLGQDHLFRARMVRLGPDNHLILITAHEIIVDAWSISVLLRDLQQRYVDAVAFCPENRASLSGYAAWEKRHVSPEALESQRHYWRRQIGDDPPVLSLGTGRARPQTNSYRGASHPVLLGGDLSSRVREFARRNSCTIDNVKLYVLDARLKRVPVGASGELCIAGRCLSAGYWQDQDRTDRCFLPNPYDGGQYDVLYRS